jgi:solute carrier family 25 phosphate transporter 23/24/25/41
MSEIGYFLAGGAAGALSRTATAPLDRIKVFLIAKAGNTAVAAASQGQPVVAVKHAARPLKDAIATVWRSGGVRAFFAGSMTLTDRPKKFLLTSLLGNGLNIIKVLPESAIKFGSFEVESFIFPVLWDLAW